MSDMLESNYLILSYILPYLSKNINFHEIYMFQHGLKHNIINKFDVWLNKNSKYKTRKIHKSL